MLAEKPWQTVSVLWLGFWLMVSLVVGMTLVESWKAKSGESLESGAFVPFVISTLSFHGMILVLTGWFLKSHGMGWSEAFGFREPRQNRAVLLAAGVAIVALPVGAVLAQLSARVMMWLQLEPVAQQAVTTVQSTTGMGRQVYLAFMAIGLAPVAEEILFRGILYPLMRRISNPCAAIWVTSVIFGVFHMNAMTFLPLTLLGATLALLYEKTGNLMSPILAHSLFNLANFFLLVFPTADGGG